MKRAMSPLVLSAASAFLAAFSSVSAHAAFVGFVSPDGNSGNDCLTPTTACREIFNAIDKIDGGGGTIFVAPGEYAAFGADESVHIIADEGPAIVGNSTLPAYNSAIGVDIAANQEVLIRGLVATAGFSGIRVRGAGTVRLEDCTFVAGLFGDAAITYVPTGASELYISNASISARPDASGAAGILVTPDGSASAKVVIDGTRVEDTPRGIVIDGGSSTGSLAVIVRNSMVTGSATFGLNAVDGAGGAVNVTVEGTTLGNNVTQGVVANGANVTVRVSNSNISNNGRGIQFANSAKLISQGGNVVAGNTVDGVFTSSVGQK
jgi:hypothetical protein